MIKIYPFRNICSFYLHSWNTTVNLLDMSYWNSSLKLNAQQSATLLRMAILAFDNSIFTAGMQICLSACYEANVVHVVASPDKS